MFGHELLGNGCWFGMPRKLMLGKRPLAKINLSILILYLLSSTSLHETFDEQAIQMSCSIGKDISCEKAY